MRSALAVALPLAAAVLGSGVVTVGSQPLPPWRRTARASVAFPPPITPPGSASLRLERTLELLALQGDEAAPQRRPAQSSWNQAGQSAEAGAASSSNNSRQRCS